MSRIIKDEASQRLVDIHLEFFNSIPKEMSPCNIRRNTSTKYAYDFVVGRQIMSSDELKKVYGLMEKNVWFPDGKHVEPLDKTDSIDYANYVADVAHNLRIDIPRALSTIVHEVPTPVYVAHGDLTFENILLRYSNEVILIDPGDTHGYRCLELEHGKLMQSMLANWEFLKGLRYNTCQIPLPFKPTKLDKAVYISHLVRLCAHPEKHSEMVINKIKSIIQIEEGRL